MQSTRSVKSIGWLVIGVLMVPLTVAAQPASESVNRTQEAPPAVETMDVFDLVRQLRHKQTPTETWDYHKRMIAFSPVIGSKPSSGVLFGAAGNVAFYRGDPSTTKISSMVTSFTFSTKKQTSLTNRFTIFGADSRWRLDADHRLQWTSLETYALGTSADTSAGVTADFDFFRLHHTAYYRLGPAVYAGAGLYFDNHTSVGPNSGEEAGWAQSPVRDLQRGAWSSTRLADRGRHQPGPSLGQPG